MTCKNCYWMNESFAEVSGIYWCDEHEKQVSPNGNCYDWKEKEAKCNTDYCDLEDIDG